MRYTTNQREGGDWAAYAFAATLFLGPPVYGYVNGGLFHAVVTTLLIYTVYAAAILSLSVVMRR